MKKARIVIFPRPEKDDQPSEEQVRKAREPAEILAKAKAGRLLDGEAGVSIRDQTGKAELQGDKMDPVWVVAYEE